ncbi:prephenate dehydrogenase [Nakamurella sp. DB0629]|uniref:Prephenate dehydrogenase n=2 Tax=Nakamurella aerolata TaxID=1656892 RepID=A0A849ACY9_9ACTN|nr:prephenate dehydrogenase [Nakamurella aerolata]
MTVPPPAAEAPRRAVCILGLGLIGGSLGRALLPTRQVGGWSPGEDSRRLAAAAGFAVADDLPGALRWADERDAIVVLAAELTAFTELLRGIARYAPHSLLTDVGSVKTMVSQQVSTITPQARYVGGHPMAGTAESGFGAGSAELFRGRTWVTTLAEHTDPLAWAEVAAMAIDTGARVVPTTDREHDAAVARISHLPHLMALTLAQAGEQGGPLALRLAAGSFADGTRVAATRPELIRAMCENNIEALVNALDDALAMLGVGRASLASTRSIATAATLGHQARLQFERQRDRRDSGGTLLTLTDPTVDQLLDVGASGGDVVGVGLGQGGSPIEVRAELPENPAP